MSKEEQKTGFIMTYSWSAAGMIQDIGCGGYVELSALQRSHNEAARLEGERAEQWRLRRDAEADRDTKAAVIAELRDQLGECKGEYDRAVNKVDALRDQLAEAHALFSDVLSIDVPRTAQSLERMRSILSGRAEPAPIAWHVGGNGYDEVAFDYPAWVSSLGNDRPAINAINDIAALAILLRGGSTVSKDRAEPANKEIAQ